MTSSLLLAQSDYDNACRAATAAAEALFEAEGNLKTEIRSALLPHFDDDVVYTDGLMVKVSTPNKPIRLCCDWDNVEKRWSATFRATSSDDRFQSTMEWTKHAVDPVEAVCSVLLAAEIDITSLGLAIDLGAIETLKTRIWRDPSNPYVKPTNIISPSLAIAVEALKAHTRHSLSSP